MATEHPKWASGVSSSKINLLEAQQANAQITGNILWVINGLFAGGLHVQDRDLLATPASPTNGQAWIIAASGTITGTWSTDGASNGDIAIYWNGWYYVTPDTTTALTAFIDDEKQWWSWSPSGQEWHPVQEIWSATEHWTGKYNGSSKVYSKSFTNQTLPGAGGTLVVPHGITSLDLDKRIVVQVPAYDSSGVNPAFQAPVVFSATGVLYYIVEDTNVLVSSGGMDFSIWKCDIRMEYCK